MTAVDNRPDTDQLAPAAQYPVLYVDDESENLLVFRAVFGDEFRVLTAQSAEEALQVLARERVAVLVADQRMPHVSGIELCHMVWERRPEVRRMLLTAYSDHRTAVQAINRGGVHAYLEKPWDPTSVRKALWEAINRVHLDRMVASLRGELAERDLKLEQARVRERILHDVANATTRLTLSTHGLRRLIDQRGSDVPQEVREALEREVDALVRTTEHLVRLQRERSSTRPFGEVSASEVRLDELLQTVAVLAGFPSAGQLELRIEVPPGLSARADRLSLTRILVNLIQNSRQAFEVARRAVGTVCVRAYPQDDRVVVDVADDGPGIPEELRERVFEEFFSTRRAAGGTGLGLATARELARSFGGTLELPQQPRRGALFRLILPRPSA